MKHTFLLLLLFLPPLSCQRLLGPVATGAKVGNFALLDEQGDFQELYYYSDFKAVILFVHGRDCPIVRNQVPALNQLNSEYEARGVKFLGINANLQDDRGSIARDAAELGVSFPILVDESQHVVRSLGVERTAEAILIETASWRIAYRGPIDDRLDYGVQRAAPRQAFLESALESLLAGRSLDQPVVQTPGCLIRFQEMDSAELSYEAVVPILQEHCVSCHQDGGVAPFAMDSHPTLYGWAPMIREVVRTRRMPPWSLDPHVGELSSPRLLTSDQERVLLGWIDAGSPPPVSADPLFEAKRAPSSAWGLGEPDLIVEFEEQAIPATGVIPYRYAKARIRVEEKVWVAAAELRGTDPELLHHALVFAAPSTAQVVNSRSWYRHVFAMYAPGIGPDLFPDDTGKPLLPGEKVILQLHYTPRGTATVDRPRLGLYFHEVPPRRELRVAAAFNYTFRIPPYARRFPVHGEREFKRDTLLYSLRTHMHYRGHSMRVWATLPTGETRPLVSVPNYLFDWQSRYVLSEPMFLPAGSRIEADAIFDNSSQNRYNPDPSKDVGWGFGQVEDEMLLVYLHYVEVKGKGRKGTE